MSIALACTSIIVREVVVSSVLFERFSNKHLNPRTRDRLRRAHSHDTHNLSVFVGGKSTKDPVLSDSSLLCYAGSLWDQARVRVCDTYLSVDAVIYPEPIFCQEPEFWRQKTGDLC